MKIDFHIHTNFSYDGLDSPQEIVEAAISKGLDCICIVDHHETRGATEALRFSLEKPLLVIPGVEIKSREGDVLALNVEENIPNGLGAKETIKKINELRGMAVIPHPFAWPKHFKGDLRKLFKENPGFSLAIEVINASVPDFFNKKTLAFARELNLPYTVGSDAHGADFVGKVYLEVKGENLSPEQIFYKVKERSSEFKKEAVSFFEKSLWEVKRNIQKFKSKRLKV